MAANDQLPRMTENTTGEFRHEIGIGKIRNQGYDTPPEDSILVLTSQKATGLQPNLII